MPHHKAAWRSEGIAPRILNHWYRWMCEVSFTPWRLCSWAKRPHITCWLGGRIQVFWDVTLRHWEVGLGFEGPWTVITSRWMQHVPSSKWQKAFNHQRDVISHKIKILEKSLDLRGIELRSSILLDSDSSVRVIPARRCDRGDQVAESFLLSAIAEGWPSIWAIAAHCYYRVSPSHSCSLLFLRADQVTESVLLNTITESWPSHGVILLSTITEG
jgi:hypothetical protein